MCVSVKLESDLFRNTAVCLRGCSPPIKSADRKRETAYLHFCAPTFLDSLVSVHAQVIRGVQNMNIMVFLRAKGC